MDFALQAALLGAVMGSAVLAVSTVYAMALPAASPAFGWWAAAFLLDTASEAVFFARVGPVGDVSDVLDGCAAVLMAAGVATFLGRRVRWGWGPAGLAAVLLWALAAGELRRRFALAEVPLFGIGGVPVLGAAWAFVAHRQPSRTDGHTVAAASFAACGLHRLAGPLLAAGPVLATWGLVSAQLIATVMAVALLLVVLRRQQALTESEGRRAALLHSHLVEALGSVQDGVALYDADDRLVTCNDRYREVIGPSAQVLQLGVPFRTVLEHIAGHGVVPAAAGREAEWVEAVAADHASCAIAPLEEQMWDGRWLAISVFPTADGGHLRILSDITKRKQAEQALTDSVAWLRGIMDTVVDGLITIDDQGTVLSFNPAASRIFGYPPEEVLGRNVCLLMPEPEQSAHDDAIARYRATGSRTVVGIGRQVEGRRKDGSVFPMELAMSELRQGDLVTFIGVLRDITDRKRVEEALVDSEQRFRDLAESASDWFWETDADLRFSYVSGRVRHVLGLGPEVFLGKAFADLRASALEAGGWEAQRRLMAARQPFRGFVFRQPLPSGELKYVEMAGRPVQDSAGGFRGYRGTASDITLVKRQEGELAEQSALRQAIIDNMGQGVLVFDGGERLVALNFAARHLLDLPVGEVDHGITQESLLLHLALQGELGPGDPQVRVAERLEAIRRRPNDVFEHARPGGTVIEVRCNAMPGGGLIQTFTDITERKRTEDTLRDAKDAAERGNRAKATFLANISHELRTPLNAIIGFSELMKHEIYGALEPEPYRSYVDDINESGMHLLELINDILDMSKAEAGMTDLIDSSVDLAQVVHSSMRMMARRAQMHRIDLVEDLPEDLPMLRADERRVRQIVLNLLSNAVKFTDENGRVTVSARVAAEGLDLTVTDTGIGMTEAELGRVMEPFVQADARLSRKYEGTGLGLPLTKALVTAHGGTLTLASTPGIGTSVTVRFPARRIIRAAPPAAAVGGG